MWPWRQRRTFRDGTQPHEPQVQRIVTDRVFILGLDELYREAAKKCEATELLQCARRVASALGVPAASGVPVEGYYTESHQLTEYFLLMRALQGTPRERAAEIGALPEYQRLLEIARSPHVGVPVGNDKLLPVARDPLSEALTATNWPDWCIGRLVDVAAERAESGGDFSLVGLAARTRDPVLLAAVRESVVLYAEVVLGTGPPDRHIEEYIWHVSPELAELGKRFILTVNELLNARLPLPDAPMAESYWHAAKRNDVVGRCVRIGYADREDKVLHYHWAIKQEDGWLGVHEFWDERPWTTAMYRQVYTPSSS